MEWNKQIYDISFPQITQFLLIEAIISSKTSRYSGRKRQKEAMV